MHAPVPSTLGSQDAVDAAGSAARDREQVFADAGANAARRPPADAAAGPSASIIADTRIGQLLLQAGRLTADNVERIARTQAELGLRFGATAMRLGLVNQDDVDAALARQFACPLAARGDSALSSRLVAAFHPAGIQGDTLRAMRSQLLLRWFGMGQHALAISGVGSGDASSVLAANLALVFAQLGQRTLLVDANLRHGVQHGLFGLHAQAGAARPGMQATSLAAPGALHAVLPSAGMPATDRSQPDQSGAGLSDVLAGRAGLDAIVGIPGFGTLSLLSSGTVPPNPQELLERPSFGALHAQLGALYDVVLYDVAPTSHGAEALAVARHAGAALLVAHKDHTPLAAIKRLAWQMSGAQIAVIGSVLVEA